MPRLSGTATVDVEGSVPDRAAGSCELWRYRAAGDVFLQIEKWPDKTVTLAGESVHKDMVAGLPGALRARASEDENMYKVVLLRHGESDWNQENRFTGWTDVDLSAKGREEAKAAGQLLKSEGFTFDQAFTSVLKRAIRTLWLALDEMDLLWLPVERTLAPERTALRRPAGAEQGRDRRQVRRRPGQGLAAQLRHPAAAAGRQRRALPRPRSPLQGRARRPSCR